MFGAHSISNTPMHSTIMQTPTPMSTTQIRYRIASCSDHSGRYVADHIRVDRPMDQSSRWSSAKDNSIHGKSWILLELENPAVVESITFGKFHKIHSCNMKDFEVHVGMSQEYMKEVIRSSLKNDPKSESFPIAYRGGNGTTYPIKYVKIVILSAHGANYNTSIWYVNLSGNTDESYVRQVLNTYERDRETLAMRHVIKHLRQRRYISICQDLLNRSGVELEHPLVTKLYEMLVLRGDWASTEKQLRVLSSAGLFSSYIHSCQPRAQWRRLQGTDANGDAPSARGGHAMCIDETEEKIYLFGGYDGRRSLDDFWVYDIREARWTVISHSVSEEKNGPGPRACHKMVFNPANGCIYMLGRLADQDFGENVGIGNTNVSGAASIVNIAAASSTSSPDGSRGSENGGTPSNNNNNNAATASVPVGTTTSTTPPAPPPLAEFVQGTGQVQSAWRNRRSVGVGTPGTVGTPTQSQPTSGTPQEYLSEFFRYRTRGLDKGKWELLDIDTAEKGGPKLVYDHQLALDAEAQILYVQGGRVVDGDWNTPKYSGLFGYDLRTGKWNALQTVTTDGAFPSRFGHSMLLEPIRKRLYILAGQKEEYLSDMWEYDIRSRSMTELFLNFTSAGGPDACFAQRAVLDPELKEVYVFAGLTRKNISTTSALPVSLYRYDTRPGTWMRIPPAPQASQEVGPVDHREWKVPITRCACQVVYHSKKKTFYLHGGNNAEAARRETNGGAESERRLNDFWSMTLQRPSPEEIIRRATFEIRRQQFRELCEDQSPATALRFLQCEVSSVVNHDDNEEAANFRSLLAYLLSQPPPALNSEPQIHHHHQPLQSGFSISPSQGSSPSSDSHMLPHVDMDNSKNGKRPARASYSSSSSASSSESTTSSASCVTGSGEWTSEIRADEDEEMEDVSNVPEGSNSEEMMPSRNQTLSEETVFSGLAASTSGSGTGTEREHHHRPEIHSHHEPRSHHDSRSHHNPHSRPSAIKEAPGRDDPYELRLRGGRTLSDERFIQRTEVFEKLLKLVNPGDEEPEARLVDVLGSLL